MKILICNKNLKKLHTGTSRNVYEQIRYFVSKGYEVNIAAETLDTDSIKSFGAIPHKTLRLPWLSGYKRRSFYSKQCDKIRRSIKPDLTIGHGDYQNPDIHCIHNNIHLAYEKIHGDDIDESDDMYRIHTPIFKNRSFKHIIANSGLAKSDLNTRFGIPKKDITVVYPAVNEKKFHRIDDERIEEIRNSLNVNNNEILIGLITSGDFKKRGLDIFFKALTEISEKDSRNIKILLIGESNIPEHYLSIIESSNIKEKILFLPIQNNIEEYFNALDVFILPSRIEEFGRVVAEAMACGCPIITNTDVGASEILKNESRKYIYSNQHPEQIPEMLTELINSRVLRERLSINNLESVRGILEINTYPEFDKVFSAFL
ncbi:glycosyltransferase [Vibrio ishigakensis]|uniref:Glycosyltransferase n=1 Tax=Vibrio ishigakensis TaxID=1481914 RepID=A0A0B8NJ55_9VIBR|nr:glycosyltransferase family 4 protein [Vibrio ishigakensis]GAM54720.1 glycosyltransferase [Vibrio ishigakensis]